MDPEEKTELEELSELVTKKMPRRNKRAEIEKKKGDRQRSDLKLTYFGPLPVQLRGYAFDIKESDNWCDDHVRRRQEEHGDIDTMVIIDRIVSTSPPTTKPALRKLNEKFRKNRDEAIKKITRLNPRTVEREMLKNRKVVVVSNEDGRPGTV